MESWNLKHENLKIRKIGNEEMRKLEMRKHEKTGKGNKKDILKQEHANENGNCRKWRLENEKLERCTNYNKHFFHKDLFQTARLRNPWLDIHRQPTTASLAHSSNATQNFLGFNQASGSLIQSIFQMLNTRGLILQLHVFELDLKLQDHINFGTELCLQRLGRTATRLFQSLAALKFQIKNQKTPCIFEYLQIY